MEIPNIEIHLRDAFPRTIKTLKFIGHILTGPHELSTHGEHLFEHPLDTPIKPVIDFPVPDIHEIRRLLAIEDSQGELFPND